MCVYMYACIYLLLNSNSAIMYLGYIKNNNVAIVHFCLFQKVWL